MNDGKSVRLLPVTKEDIIDAVACGEGADRPPIEQMPGWQLPQELPVKALRFVSIGPKPTFGQLVTLSRGGWHLR